RHRKSMYNFQQLPYDHHEWDYASWGCTGLVEQRMKCGDVSPVLRREMLRTPARFRKQIDWILARPPLRSALFKLHNGVARVAAASADKLEPELALARALELAGVTEPLPRPQVATTRNRTITRRGVLWLGQTCNLRCYFCYFLDRIESREHPEHPFMSLDKAKEICKTLVDVYGNNAIDIQGGEPTIWYAILDLVRYCHEIGLEPTLITNALVLENLHKCK